MKPVGCDPMFGGSVTRISPQPESARTRIRIAKTCYRANHLLMNSRWGMLGARFRMTLSPRLKMQVFGLLIRNSGERYLTGRLKMFRPAKLARSLLRIFECWV